MVIFAFQQLSAHSSGSAIGVFARIDEKDLAVKLCKAGIFSKNAHVSLLEFKLVDLILRRAAYLEKYQLNKLVLMGCIVGAAWCWACKTI